MLTNLTNGMGSLIFLPRQQLYPVTIIISTTKSGPLVQFQLSIPSHHGGMSSIRQ